MAVTKTKPNDYTAIAINQVRELARYLDRNAPAIIGDITGVYVREDGIKIECTLDPRDTLPTVTVSKSYIVLDKQ